MLKSIVIAVSTVMAVALSAGAQANAFGLASAARTIAPKPLAASTQSSDIACAVRPADCRRGQTFFLNYDLRIKDLLAAQTGTGDALVDALRRDMNSQQQIGERYARLVAAHALHWKI
ncbi:MAG TPA: hypothetical protein VE079_09640 [Ensifer sp.]|nr:hypothetical protein [Ensifer sp.]